MCGIVGYAGPREAVPILLDGLKRLEYRGYDSAGVAVLEGGVIGVLRSVGKISNLNARLSERPLSGTIGVGHTRWATHGSPSEINAHPHADCTGKVAVIHNGIIENYLPLKLALIERGHTFRSATDTEVVAHLIEEKLRAFDGTSPSLSDGKEFVLIEAMRAAIKEVRGSYALAVLWSEMPEAIIAAKADSPLVIGIGEREHFMASDVPAFIKHTRQVVYLDDGELAVLRGQGCSFFDPNGVRIEKAPMTVQWDADLAEKSGYKHFMLKEIHEQSQVIDNTLRGRLLPLNDGILERETGMTKELLKDLEQTHIVACGTSWHAGLIGKYLLERYARIHTQAEISSEFRYRKPVLPPGTLVTAISQSGETADTLAAIRLAHQEGHKVLSICNVIGSAIPRASDFKLHTFCGPECGVASTKAFVGQLVALNIVALHLSVTRGLMSEKDGMLWVEWLKRLPGLIHEALRLEDKIREIAEIFKKSEHFLFIGRGINYPVALEGALKLKEISYVHAEGYPAGEMKHGPLALIDANMPVLAIATQSEVFEKTLSNIEEAKARGAKIIALCTQGERRLREKADFLLELPEVSEIISPIVNVIPLQLLAYHIADLRGCDVDQPRNLAKSVTVE